MLWLRKSLDCLPEKAKKICTASYHQHLISSIELCINIVLVKLQIPPCEGREEVLRKRIVKENYYY